MNFRNMKLDDVKFDKFSLPEFIRDELGYKNSVSILFALNDYPDYDKLVSADIIIKLANSHPPLVVKHRRKVTPFFLKDSI